MPSEDRVQAALQALAPARAAFQAAVVAAVEELRGYIMAHRPVTDTTLAAAASLGPFAEGRVDPVRFGTLFAHNGRLASEQLARLEQALETLRDFTQQGADLFRIRVASGADLRDSLRSALAARGRVFAAARVAELIRSGRGSHVPTDEHGGFPFRLWNRAERQIAPPLVVEVDGGDLQVSSLAEYLDGQFKLVLLVNEPSPAAPLVRLIAPNVFVHQGSDPAALDQLASFAGPALAALVPAGCAAFTWNPAAGPRFEQQLQVLHIPPEEQQPRTIGSIGVAQQQADVQWLRELNELRQVPSSVVESAAAQFAESARVEMLTAWLLRQSSLDGV